MITWTGWDAQPDAMLVPEAVCDVCAQPASSKGDAAMIVQVWWRLGDDELWTPPLVVHKGQCDRIMSGVINASGGNELWEDLLPWCRQLSHNVNQRTPRPGATISGTRYMRRQPRRIDLRRTAELLDVVHAALGDAGVPAALRQRTEAP